jgi:hypothetical protein
MIVGRFAEYFSLWDATNFGRGDESCSLTFASGGLRCRYHLRSQSGSNGPIAKEESPLLGWRPILSFRFIPATGVHRADAIYFSQRAGEAERESCANHYDKLTRA